MLALKLHSRAQGLSKPLPAMWASCSGVRNFSPMLHKKPPLTPNFLALEGGILLELSQVVCLAHPLGGGMQIQLNCLQIELYFR